MNIKVFCDNEKVYEGPLEQFLLDNDNNEWLVSECKRLEGYSIVQFNEISGEWKIERIN